MLYYCFLLKLTGPAFTRPVNDTNSSDIRYLFRYR